MHSMKLLAWAVLTAGAVVLPLSSASAQCCWRHYHHYGPVGGVVDAAGAVVEGAAIVATAPIALAAGILSAPFAAADDYGPYYGPPGYYAPPYAYGPSYYYGPGYYYGPRHWHRHYYRRAYCCSYGY